MSVPEKRAKNKTAERFFILPGCKFAASSPRAGINHRQPVFVSSPDTKAPATAGQIFSHTVPAPGCKVSDYSRTNTNMFVVMTRTDLNAEDAEITERQGRSQSLRCPRITRNGTKTKPAFVFLVCFVGKKSSGLARSF